MEKKKLSLHHRRKKAEYERDPLKFIKEIWYGDTMCGVRKVKQADCLGKIHELLLDFMRLGQLDAPPADDGRFEASVPIYSDLKDHLPERKPGDPYPERWIWIKSWDQPWVIHDGPDNPISRMYQDEPWLGVIMRIKDFGYDKCVLIPRGHLKSSVLSRGFQAWQLLREPWRRHLLLSETSDLAKDFLGEIKNRFNESKIIKEYWGDFLPKYNKRAGADTIDTYRFSLPPEQRVGSEATMKVLGLESRKTGKHFNAAYFDDIVGEHNTGSPDQIEKVRGRAAAVAPIRDLGSEMNDIGTPWDDNDAHSIMTQPDGALYEYSSFLVASCYMDDESMLWPEYGEYALKKAIAGCASAYFAACQYWCQPRRGSTQTFKPEDIMKYSGDPKRVALREKLSVYMFVDPANSTKKGSDYSACVIVGQDPEGRKRYILDGFADRLDDASLPGAIAGKVIEWHKFCAEHKLCFKWGFEAFSWQKYLRAPIYAKLRKTGWFLHPVEMSHNNQSKDDRIRTLAQPVNLNLYHVPEKGIICFSETDKREYNFIERFMQQLKRFPTGSKRDILDACSYLEQMMEPESAPLENPIVNQKRLPSTYSRTPEIPVNSVPELKLQRPQYNTPTRDSYSRTPVRRLGIAWRQ